MVLTLMFGPLGIAYSNKKACKVSTVIFVLFCVLLQLVDLSALLGVSSSTPAFLLVVAWAECVYIGLINVSTHNTAVDKKRRRKGA